jgi:hypothetical protein
MAHEDTLTVRVVIGEGDVSGLEAALDAAGATVVAAPTAWEPPAGEQTEYGDAQFEPLTIMAIGATAGFLAERLSRIWMRHTKEGGQIVDLRESPPTLRFAPGLDHGELLVIGPDGRESFYPRSTDETAELLQSVLAGAGA